VKQNAQSTEKLPEGGVVFSGWPVLQGRLVFVVVIKTTCTQKNACGDRFMQPGAALKLQAF
jgi:hypothetical protein